MSQHNNDNATQLFAFAIEEVAIFLHCHCFVVVDIYRPSERGGSH